MSKSCRELNNLNTAGFNFWANAIALSCWGMSVPNIDVIARMISRKRVSLTELNIFHMIFEFFLKSVFFMIYDQSDKCSP